MTSTIDADRLRRDFAAVHAAYLRLIEEGRWLSGPRDLMSILGETDLELPHSAVVAWLLDPTGRHGLGTALLRRILRAGWPEDPAPELAGAIVRREVPRDDGVRPTRADIVVWMDRTILVIENKVWAPEDPGQCEALHRTWVSEADDVRFLLLSRDGHLPYTAESPEARTAWRATSYRHVAGILDELMVPTAAHTATMAVLQYREALRALVGDPVPFRVSRQA